MFGDWGNNLTFMSDCKFIFGVSQWMTILGDNQFGFCCNFFGVCLPFGMNGGFNRLFWCRLEEWIYRFHGWQYQKNYQYQPALPSDFYDLKNLLLCQWLLQNLFAVGKRMSNRNPSNVRNQCRGEPYVRPPDKNRYQTYVRQWIWNDCLGHRFSTDCCSEGEHKVRPYIGFGHWLNSITTIYPKIYDRLLSRRS